LWKDNDYMRWYDSPEGAFLWIQGKPGSGKSTLCKKIYERLKIHHNLMDFDALEQTTKSGAPMPNPPKGDTVLASFFFSLRGAKTETSNTQMLQSLLYQILYQQRWLYPSFRDSYRALRPRAESREATMAWSFEALHTVFRNLAEVTLLDQRLEIYLLVDALDESEKEERDRVLTLLREISRKQTPPTSCVFKCVLASRPEDDIKSGIMKNRTSHLIPEDKNKGDIQSSNVRNAISHLILEDKNKDDIKTVIEVKLKLLRDSATDSPKTSETQSAAARPEDTELGELLKFAAGYLESKAQGVFIWVEIATRELEKLFAKGYMPGRVKEILKRFPVELGPFYKRIANDLINRFKESNTLKESLQEARRVLTWTTFAERPLFISEFRDAFAIPDSVEGILIRDFNDQRLGNDKAVELRMAGVCGDLVEIRHGIIQLLHLTVREFLLRDQSATLEVTQGELGITVREFLLRDQSATQSSLEVTRGEFDMTVREFLLLNQSATQFSMKVAQGELYISLACIRYLQVVFTQLPPMANPDPERFVGFLSQWHLLSYILRFLPRHLRNTGDRREEAHRAGAEFADAITCENESACWLLDAWLVKAGLRQQSHGHPAGFIPECITAAGERNLLDTAFALLETVNENTEADVGDEDVDKRYGDILLGLSRIGVYQLIPALLEMGADPNYKGRDGDTPLIVASMESNYGVVDKLVRAGARPNVQGKNGTPLLAAVTGGDRDMVRLLLEAGADPNSGLGVDGASTALLAASSRGHSGVVKLLLRAGADPNSGLGVDGASTPLFKASAAGHELVVKMLLRSRANPNIPSYDPDGSGDLLTPLQAAEAAGHMEVANMLREAEAMGLGEEP
jgi:ankyrin repeat protein